MNKKKHQIKQKKKKIQYLKNYYSHTEISHQFQLRKKKLSNHCTTHTFELVYQA